MSVNRPLGICRGGSKLTVWLGILLALRAFTNVLFNVGLWIWPAKASSAGCASGFLAVLSTKMGIVVSFEDFMDVESETTQSVLRNNRCGIGSLVR